MLHDLCMPFTGDDFTISNDLSNENSSSNALTNENSADSDSQSDDDLLLPDDSQRFQNTHLDRKSQYCFICGDG